MNDRLEELMRNPKTLEVLERMLKVSRIVASKSNKEIAEALVSLTDDKGLDTYHYHLMMEAALRIAPEIFEEEGDEKTVTVSIPVEIVGAIRNSAACVKYAFHRQTIKTLSFEDALQADRVEKWLEKEVKHG